MFKEDNPAFLPFFFTEPIYMVNEKSESQEAKSTSQEKEIEEESAAATSPPALPVLPYQGKNLKKVLILYENEEGNQLNKNEEIFLGKILHAVGLNFDDVALLNVSSIKEDDLEQANHFDALFWISFGVVHKALVIDPKFPSYQIEKSGNIQYLLADPLKEIEENKDKKILLWNNLKLLFGK